MKVQCDNYTNDCKFLTKILRDEIQYRIILKYQTSANVGKHLLRQNDVSEIMGENR